MAHLFKSRRRCVPSLGSQARLGQEHTGDLQKQCCTNHEPPAADDPLLLAWRDRNHPAFERLIVNPHAAFYSEEGLLDMRLKGSDACRRALLGQPLRNVVN